MKNWERCVFDIACNGFSKDELFTEEYTEIENSKLTLVDNRGKTDHLESRVKRSSKAILIQQELLDSSKTKSRLY